MFTDLGLNEIENIKEENINKLKVLLANKTTEMLHGVEEAKKSEQAAKDAFSNNSDSENIPSINLDKTKINSETTIIDIVVLSNLEKSKSEIRRLIKANGIKINNEIINEDNLKIDINKFRSNSLKLSIGKKRHLKINFT